MVKVTVDGKEVEIEEGSTVFQACEAAGVEIPHFCYHPKLSIAGNCRACLVEVSPIPKPIASCAYPLSEAMVIKTDTEMVEKARKGVLELLLINHPLDCPVCDQGGECDLQDITLAYGPGKSRFDLNKRIVSDKNMGPLVSTHMTRCIHCTRCIRFLDEVAGTHEIGALGRGENTEISTYLEHNLKSELSGNIIDICPVGALNNKPYAYQGRVWELEKTDSIDVLDAVGSNIRIDVRGVNVMRILPRQNDDINECWISDKTRFAYDANHNQRLDTPYIRRDGKLNPASWEDAFSYIKENLQKVKPTEFAALAGELVDCDAAFMLKELMRKMQSSHTDCRPADAQIVPNNRASYTFNTTIAGIEESDCILLIGSNPRIEAPLINARIRKRFLHENIPIAAIGPQVDLTYEVENLGEDVSVLKDILKNKHPFSKKWFKAKKPMLIVGQATLYRRDSLTIQEVAQQLCQEAGAFTEDWNGYNMLHVHGGQVGCLDVGFVPDEGGFNTREIIEHAKKGKLKAIYLLGVDSLGRSSLGNAFVIYQGHHGGKGAENADVILPGLTYMEKLAFYVNTEGRAQMTQKAVQEPGLAKEDWKIIRALSEYLGKALPYDTQEQIHIKLASLSPAFKYIGGVIKNSLERLPTGSYESLSHTPLQPFITNFYMSDVMTQHSKNMANCISAQKEIEKYG
jgi:NADH-quinone oxidoreductase subunit G